MMKHSRRVSWLYISVSWISASILIVACSNQDSQPTKVSPTRAPDIIQPTKAQLDIGDGGFLSKTPCGPPCFMGITPGISKEDEVLGSLQERIDLSNCDAWDTREAGGTRGIRCGTLGFTFQESNIVDGIGFEINEDIPVIEVIAAYGNPDSLFVVEEVDDTGNIISVQMNLYFDSIYTKVDLIVQQNSVYDIRPSTLVGGISYLDHSTYEKYKVGTKPWEGFGEYPVSTLP